MADLVDIDQIAQVITKQLAKYADVVEEEVDEVAKRLSKEGAERLKQTSPVRAGKSTGYATGWKVKKQKDDYVIWNAEHYQLTHLLEFGHVTRGGGRTNAQTHIKPVEQKLIKDFEKEVIKAVER